MKKVAIVTGSTRGIGLTTAITLAKSGYSVVLSHLSNAASAKDAAAAMKPYEHLIVKADLRKPAGAKKLIGAALKRWKRIDVLVNNVGDFFETPVSRMELDKWEILWDSNVRTALNCVREALPTMRKQRSGCIINLGGTASLVVRGNTHYIAYNMAKLSLILFSKSLAIAEGPNGIRVNIVNPGYIQTYAYTRQDVEELTPKVPLKRLGKPEDIASAIEYLASDRAAYVTGAALDVGGGLWI